MVYYDVIDFRTPYDLTYGPTYGIAIYGPFIYDGKYGTTKRQIPTNYSERIQAWSKV